MQLSTVATPAPASTIAPGTVLGTGFVQRVTTGGIQTYRPMETQIVAGETLLAGVRDIAAAGRELVRRTHQSNPATNLGLVGFVRNGDAYDAVTLLAPTFTDGSSPRQVYAPWNIGDFKPSADLAAVWQVSHYGFDAGLGTAGSMFAKGRNPMPQGL